MSRRSTASWWPSRFRRAAAEDGSVSVFEVATGNAARRCRSARQRRHRRRQRGLESRCHRLLVHPLSARGRAPGGRSEFLSAGLLSPPGHAHGARRIRRWASSFRASPKSSCDLPTTASTSWRAWPTAMAASSCTSCCCPTASGTRSRASPTTLRKPPLGRTERSICCRARTRPWARCWRSRRRRSRSLTRRRL